MSEDERREERLETIVSLIRGLEAEGFYSETSLYFANAELGLCAAASNFSSNKAGLFV